MVGANGSGNRKPVIAARPSQPTSCGKRPEAVGSFGVRAGSRTPQEQIGFRALVVHSSVFSYVFSRRKADLRRHVECVQLAAALLFDRQRALRTKSGSKLHALHMKELAKQIRFF
jgi:hypothetical protein